MYTSGVPGPLSGYVIFSRTGTDATLGDKLASLHHPLPQKSTSPCERKKKRRGRLLKVGAKRSGDRMQNKKGRGKNINNNKKKTENSRKSWKRTRERERERKREHKKNYISIILVSSRGWRATNSSRVLLAERGGGVRQWRVVDGARSKYRCGRDCCC